MTLHDRIMGLIPDDITNGGEEFYDGFAEASRKAATLAKEADELLAEMALTLKYLADEPFNSGTAAVMVQRYNTYKESKQ